MWNVAVGERDLTTMTSMFRWPEHGDRNEDENVEIRWNEKHENQKWVIRMRLNGLTLTRASVRLVHMAISSRVDISGYRFLLNVCSNSCNCCDVKCVRCRLCRLFFLSFFVSSLATICSSCITKFVFSTLTLVSFSDRFPAKDKMPRNG